MATKANAISTGGKASKQWNCESMEEERRVWVVDHISVQTNQQLIDTALLGQSLTYPSGNFHLESAASLVVLTVPWGVIGIVF